MSDEVEVGEVEVPEQASLVDRLKARLNPEWADNLPAGTLMVAGVAAVGVTAVGLGWAVMHGWRLPGLRRQPKPWWRRW